MEENNKKRSYTEIVASFETHARYINNHLENIDGQLEVLTNSITENTKRSVANKTNINGLRWLIGGIGTALLAIVLKVLEVY